MNKIRRFMGGLAVAVLFTATTLIGQAGASSGWVSYQDCSAYANKPTSYAYTTNPSNPCTKISVRGQFFHNGSLVWSSWKHTSGGYVGVFNQGVAETSIHRAWKNSSYGTKYLY